MSSVIHWVVYLYHRSLLCALRCLCICSARLSACLLACFAVCACIFACLFCSLCLIALLSVRVSCLLALLSVHVFCLLALLSVHVLCLSVRVSCLLSCASVLPILCLCSCSFESVSVVVADLFTVLYVSLLVVSFPPVLSDPPSSSLPLPHSEKECDRVIINALDEP